MEHFIVRPMLDGSGQPLIEFRGAHRSENFPKILTLLERHLPGFKATGSSPAPDDFLWSCTYASGTFELSDDWGGLFILPRSNHAHVVGDVSVALESSGQFCRGE